MSSTNLKIIERRGKRVVLRNGKEIGPAISFELCRRLGPVLTMGQFLRLDLDSFPKLPSRREREHAR